MTDANSNHWSHDDDAGEIGSKVVPNQGDAVEDYDEPEDVTEGSDDAQE